MCYHSDTDITQSFTYKMAAKINRNKYGTNLRHCHPRNYTTIPSTTKLFFLNLTMWKLNVKLELGGKPVEERLRPRRTDCSTCTQTRTHKRTDNRKTYCLRPHL